MRGKIFGKICENHFSTMPPGLTSPFTFEERKWIILKFGELKSATLVRRAFQKQFPKSSPRDVPNRKQFQRVLEQFNGSGDVKTITF